MATPHHVTRPPHAPRAVRVRVPARWLEYLYYGVTAYSIFAAYLGVEIPLMAAGLTLTLAVVGLHGLGLRGARATLAPVALLLVCILSFVAIQVVVHGLGFMDETIRTFILWMCGIVIIRVLCLRSGFTKRCTVFLFLVGLVAVPSLAYAAGSVERASAGVQIGGNLRNANGLGAWFGFCLVSFGMFGLQARRGSARLILWAAATVCLLVAGLSVSRGALLASILALAVGFRGLLKRGFQPVLLLSAFSLLVLNTDLFERIVTLYEQRGLEDTGRLQLWPHVIDRTQSSILAGVGAQNLATYIPELNTFITTPHNSFLYFGLSAGVIPLACWTLFWVRAGVGSLRHTDWSEFRLVRLPFFVYSLMLYLTGDITLDPWVLLCLAVAAGSGIRARSAEAYRSRERTQGDEGFVPIKVWDRQRRTC